MRTQTRMEVIGTACAAGVAGILVMLFLFYTTQKAVAGPSTPTVDSVAIGTETNGAHTDPLVLFAGTTRTFYVNGTVSDADGYQDINRVQLTFHRGGVGINCGLDDNNCYRNLNCDLTNGSGNSIDYNCTVPVQYFADATDAGTHENRVWFGRVRAIDSSSNTSTIQSASSEMSSLAAASTVSSINFGLLGLGETRASNVSIEVFNEGNRGIDIQASSDADLTCETGTIPRSSIKFDSQDVSYSSLSNTLSSTPAALNDTIPQQTDDSVQTSTLQYWNVKIPDVLVKGACTGAVTLTAFIP